MRLGGNKEIKGEAYLTGSNIIRHRESDDFCQNWRRAAAYSLFPRI